MTFEVGRGTSRWGVCLGPAWGTSIADLIEPAVAAEAAGFDRVAIGEYRSDSLTWMSILASATSHVRVATTITSIALRHPTVTAEAFAALSDIHGDRVELGLGVSHQNLVRGDLGLDQPSIDDLEQYVATVSSVLAGRSIETERYRAPIHDRSRRARATAPIRVSVLGKRAAERAARYAGGLILTWTPPTWTRQISDAARRARRGGRSPDVWVVLPTFPSSDRAEAMTACARHLRQYLRLPAYRQMLEASSDEPDRIHRACDESKSDAAVADILGAAFLEGIAGLGSREHILAAIDTTRRSGADAVILYPLDAGSGWRSALELTLDRLSPR